MATRHRHHHVAAVFADRRAAEKAIAELREHGWGSAELGAAVKEPGRHAFEQDADADVVRDTERGVAIGAPIGFLAGIALATPGIGLLGVGGILAIGIATGIGGSMLGGIFGLAAADDSFELHEELADLPLAAGEILVAACAREHGPEIAEIMTRHGGRVVEQT